MPAIIKAENHTNCYNYCKPLGGSMTRIDGNYNSTSGAMTEAAKVVRSAKNTLQAKAAVLDRSDAKNVADKPFSQVIRDVRAKLDEAYKATGISPGGTITGDEWMNEFGMKDMDRRSLYAIVSNQGGLFSSDEVSDAQWQMTQQICDAMKAANPFGSDHAAGAKAAINFYNSVSPEEKASLDWAKGRANSQTAYRMCMRDQGRVPENVNSGNPVVDLFVKAFEELTATDNPSRSVLDMPSWIKGLELWYLRNEAPWSLSWKV